MKTETKLMRRAASLLLALSKWPPTPRKRDLSFDTYRKTSRIWSSSSKLILHFPFCQWCDERIILQPLATMRVALLSSDGAAMTRMGTSCRCRRDGFYNYDKSLIHSKWWCWSVLSYLTILHTFLNRCDLPSWDSFFTCTMVGLHIVPEVLLLTTHTL